MKGDRYILQLMDSLDLREPVMDDSDAEFEKHKEFFENAHGDVLIIGLGIGFVNRFLRKNPRVTSITVVEISEEVIDKVRLPDNEKVIHADGLNYVPTKLYDTIWWDTYGILYPESDRQVERYRQYLKPGGWIGRFPT